MYDYIHTYLDNVLHDNRRSQEWMLGSGTFSTAKSLIKFSYIKKKKTTDRLGEKVMQVI